MSQAYKDLDKIDIVDKMNNIGNNYSIATDGIAIALQDSASALTTAGNSIDEAIALITAGNSVVQDPNSVGSGLRTISLRLTGTEEAKEELAAMGEEVDNVATTTSKLRDTIMSATKVASNGFKGFDIFDENGNFKSTYEIMQGIADIYQEIVETDKKTGNNNVNLLLETLAGKNRANIAASILQNPDLLRNVFKDSQNSAGSAQKELEKVLESIEGKLQKLSNTWQEIWVKGLNSNIVKFFINIAQGILDIVNYLGLIPSVLATIVSLLAVIYKVKKGEGRAKQNKKSNIYDYMKVNYSHQFN